MKSFLLFSMLSFMLCSCNIFKWTWSEEESSLNYNEDMYEKHIQGNNYDSALVYANKIIALDSNLYEGHYYRAKAIRYQLMGNKYTVLQELLQDSEKNDSSLFGFSLPFADYSVYKLDSIYRAVIEINNSLEYILDNELSPSRDREKILEVDLLLSYIVYGILGVQDINGNNSLIDDAQYLGIMKISIKDGDVVLEGLDSLYKELNSNPSYINDIIDESIEIFSKSGDLFGEIVDTSVISSEDLSNMITKIPNEVGIYKIGDKRDNDGDSDDYQDKNGNGLPDFGEPGVDSLGYVYQDGLDNDLDGIIDEGIDEEIIDGIDNDLDGIIDEDGTNIALVSGI